jgi:hypothetical protein
MPRTVGCTRKPGNEYVSQSRRRRLDARAIPHLAQIPNRKEMHHPLEIPRFVAFSTAKSPTRFHEDPYFAKSGGLITYASDYAEKFRQAAGYINRILKGAKPGELPVQQPIKFELVINMKTANALGLDVPLPLQQLADEVIE